MTETWANWSGAVTAEPRRIERPTSEADLQEAVRRVGELVDRLEEAAA